MLYAFRAQGKAGKAFKIRHVQPVATVSFVAFHFMEQVPADNGVESSFQYPVLHCTLCLSDP